MSENVFPSNNTSQSKSVYFYGSDDDKPISNVEYDDDTDNYIPVNNIEVILLPTKKSNTTYSSYTSVKL